MTLGPRPRIGLPRGLAPLGFSSFALYWIGFATANTGKWAEQTGAVWLASDLSGSPVLLGILGLVRAIPAIVVSPLAGVLADRVDQRRILLFTQSSSFVLSSTFAIWVADGRVELWQLYLQVAVQSAILALDNSARQALFPRLVPRDHLVTAVTLQSTAARVSSVVGPGVGGVAIAAFGTASPFVLNAATNLVLIVAVTRMRDVVPHVPAEMSSFRVQLSQGFRYLVAQPVLNRLLRMEIVYAVFQMNPVMITIIGRDMLGVGPEGLGALLAADSIGALVGIGFLLTAGPGRHPARLVVVGTLAYALTLAGLAASREYVLAFLALVVVGLFDSMVSVTRNSVMQLVAPGPMRGRVMANLGMVTRGVGPLSQAQSGFLTGLLGGPGALVAAAIALSANAVLSSRPSGALWSFDGAETERPATAAPAGSN